MRLIFGTLAAAALFAAAPAVGQVQPGVHVGMQVTDANGGPVGTVTAIKGTNLLVKTDKHEALLPSKSFTIADGKLLVSLTQAQLDAQVEQSIAAANASIAAGSTVEGISGTAVGTIESVTDGKVTIALHDGKKIAVARDGLRGNPDGTVTIGYSADQLEAMVAGGASSTDASSAPAASSGGSGQ